LYFANNLLCTYKLCRWALNVNTVRQKLKIRIIIAFGTADSQTTFRTQRAGIVLLCLHASKSLSNSIGSVVRPIHPTAEGNCRTDTTFSFLHFYKTTALNSSHIIFRYIIIRNFRNLQQVVLALLRPHQIVVCDLSEILRN
jgi:hypothetical protein